MNLLSVDWDIRALWMMLPLLSKICLLFLLTFTLFTTKVTLTIILRVKNSQHLAWSTNCLANLRQFQTLAFYFFGVCLADHLFAAIKAIERSIMSLQAERIDPFGPMAWFAFIAFLTLLFSHSLQWLASCRVIAVSRRSES
jgi:hypothetical protein